MSRSAGGSVASRLLVVEDQPGLADEIRSNLEAEGYAVAVEHDGIDALARAGERFDLIVLDVMLPGLDGFSVCERLRQAGNEVPVLFLTARSDPDDRIRGLAAGGDDYLPKPFRLEELLLRVAAILRRSRPSDSDPPPPLTFGESEVDLVRYVGRGPDGAKHFLTSKEAAILRLLTDREGEVVSRNEILDRVWGAGFYPTDRTIDNFVLRLRRRFETDPHRPQYFHTVRGAGYLFTREPRF